MDHIRSAPITVFLADDNLIVREGVRALIQRNPDLIVVGMAEDYDGVIGGATDTNPQVLVTDIRMPPSFRGRASTRPRKCASGTPERAWWCYPSTKTRSTRS